MGLIGPVCACWWYGWKLRIAGIRSSVSGLQMSQLSSTPSGIGTRTSRSLTTPYLLAAPFQVVPKMAPS